jgi:hypothetical protein
MTDLSLKPRSPAAVALAVHDPYLGSPTGSAPDARPTVALLTTADARAAANDDAAAMPDAIRNPLWVVAIGMVCLFGVIGLVMALG